MFDSGGSAAWRPSRVQSNQNWSSVHSSMNQMVYRLIVLKHKSQCSIVPTPDVCADVSTLNLEVTNVIYGATFQWCYLLEIKRRHSQKKCNIYCVRIWFSWLKKKKIELKKIKEYCLESLEEPENEHNNKSHWPDSGSYFRVGLCNEPFHVRFFHFLNKTSTLNMHLWHFKSLWRAARCRLHVTADVAHTRLLLSHLSDTKPKQNHPELLSHSLKWWDVGF